MVEILDCVGRLNVVTVVTGGLVAGIEVRGVAVYTYLCRISTEGLMLSRSLPVGVTASGRCALTPVLAEVAIEADVSGRIRGLGGIMAYAAGIVCGAVIQSVKIRGGPVQPSACVRNGNEIVTVVTGGLIAGIEVRIVAVYTHLGFVSAESLVLGRGLPVGVTASGRCALGPVLAEVAIEADVSGRICGLGGIMAYAAGIVCGAVIQSVKIWGGSVQPAVCVRYGDDVVTVVTVWSVPEPVVNLMTGHADSLLRRTGKVAVTGRSVGPSTRGLAPI